MLILLSPSKTLDLSPAPADLPVSRPRLEKDIQVLMNRCKKLSVRSIRRLMDLSEPLGELTYERFQAMELPFSPENSKPGVLAFRGDVYQGLEAESLSSDDLVWAQDHLRIISGLYGLLRPLDLMQPYRLEMGTRLSNTRGKNLYKFWGDRLARSVNTDLADLQGQAVLDLASNEYSRAVPESKLDVPVITASFQEVRDGVPKTIGFLVKRARGLMARYVVQNRIEETRDLEGFDVEGYSFNPSLSSDQKLVFTR